MHHPMIVLCVPACRKRFTDLYLITGAIMPALQPTLKLFKRLKLENPRARQATAHIPLSG